jgi:hypothetical protein
VPSSIEFVEDIHEYRVDGTVIHSVTQILQATGVVDYSYMPASVREAALIRGRKVHAATHFDDEGDLDESSISDELLGYVAAWRQYRAFSGFTPELIEHRGFNAEYRYAGTLDRLGTIGGKRTLVDIKTNTAEPWVACQLAAYAGFFKDPRTYHRVCVELHRDGTYSLPFGDLLHSGKWFEQFQDFLCCLGACNARQKYAPRKEERSAA